MTKKPEITYEEAKAIVDAHEEAQRDGVAIEYEQDGSKYRPDPNDNSVATYDPQDPEGKKPRQPAK